MAIYLNADATNNAGKMRLVTVVPIVLCLCFYAIDSLAFTKRPICDDSITLIVKKFYPNYSIVQLKDLDKDVQEYFTKTYGDAHPGCIKEDFDGDGLSDYALLLRTKRNGKSIEKVVVLRGKVNHSFSIINLAELKDRSGSFFIKHVPPGKIKKWEETERHRMKTFIIKLPGFELVLFEAASRIYFWKGNKFYFIQTSD